MCAIVTWAGKITNGVLRDLYRNASPCGPHSVGLVYLDTEKQRLNVFKKAISPFEFLRNCNHRIERAAQFTKGIGHVRWATHGAVVDRNAHPFFQNEIVYVHNGIIYNYKQLSEKHLEVDSQCLGPLIEQHEIYRALGSMGLAWFDKGEIYVYRRSQSLHAYTFNPVNDTFFTVVASRPEIVFGVEGLRGMPVGETKLEEGQVYRITNRGLIKTWKDEVAVDAPLGGRISSKRRLRACGFIKEEHVKKFDAEIEELGSDEFES